MDVLVPIDGAGSTHRTVEHAVRAYPDASITALHVLTLNAVYGMGGMYMNGSVIESQQSYAEELFATASAIADDSSVPLTTLTAVGSPVHEIVTFAKDNDIDHIVVGRCGRSNLSRLLFGSVSEGVVRRAGVPVTVVS